MLSIFDFMHKSLCTKIQFDEITLHTSKYLNSIPLSQCLSKLNIPPKKNKCFLKLLLKSLITSVIFRFYVHQKRKLIKNCIHHQFFSKLKTKRRFRNYRLKKRTNSILKVFFLLSFLHKCIPSFSFSSLKNQVEFHYRPFSSSP